VGLLLAVVFTCLLAPAAAAASFEPSPALDVDPPVILVLPSEWKSPEHPIELRARVSDSSGVGRVTAWVMGEEDEDYRPYKMEKASDGGFVAALEAWDGRGGAIVYFVEALDLLGNGPRRSAGPGNPFVLRVEAAGPVSVEQSAGTQREIAVGLLLAPLALLWLMYRQDRGQRERKFWLGLLEPVADMRGAALARAIDGFCSRTVRHPVQGEVRLTRMEIRRWMRALRESGDLRSQRSAAVSSPPWRKRRPVEAPDDDVVWLPSSDGPRAP
jgi:hypothetical protein